MALTPEWRRRIENWRKVLRDLWYSPLGEVPLEGFTTLEALTAGTPVTPLARYFEYWVLRLQGVYPPDVTCTDCGADFEAGESAFLAVDGHGLVCRSCHGAHGTDDRFLSARALAFVRGARRVGPQEAASLGASEPALRELETAHRALLDVRRAEGLIVTERLPGEAADAFALRHLAALDGGGT